MKKERIIFLHFLVGFVAFLIPLIIYYAGGGNFERDTSLSGALLFSFIFCGLSQVFFF